MIKPGVLICDDEESVRESLKLILSKAYSLYFAASGEEAMQVLMAYPYIKTVLLDIKMPRRNGIEVLKDIRSYDSGISVVIITGYQSVETAAEAIREGASNYLVKPFESKTVLDIVAKAVS